MPKIGRALKRVVEIEPLGMYAGGGRARPSSPLMNHNRRKVFQHLCFRPCSSAEGLSSATGLSRSSVSWHLERLVSSGYAERILLRRTEVFAPTGAVQGQSVHAIYILAKNNCRAVFVSVMASPGSDAGALSLGLGISRHRLRGCLRELESCQLVARLADGRHIRYYPTARYRELAAEMKTRSKVFVRRLMVKMAEEHLKPEIKDMKHGNVIIVLNVPGAVASLEIPQQIIQEA